MHAKSLTVALTVAATLTLSASAQSVGRLSFFSTLQRAEFDDGTTRDLTDITTALVFRSRVAEDADGLEYGVDVRETAYPSSNARDSRTRLYDAWAGGRMANGRLAVRGGQMWLHEFGSLGSIGGVMAEYRTRETAAGRVRFGAFGGAEPKSFEAGYVSGVKKGGAWIALDGRGLRRHVLGYVTTRNAGLTERSVLTTTNYVPAGKKLFVYQLAEYDLEGPGGQGGGGLNYFFANARFTATPRLEFMANVHRGRSIDARTITKDILDGRAVDQKALDGFLFQTVGGRVTVTVLRNLRVHAGYAVDRHNREDESFRRVSAGVWASNVGGSGFDLTLSDNRSDRPAGSYDSWYASLGRGFGSKVYVTIDYATSLAVIHALDSGAEVEQRPRSRRYGASGLWNVTRAWSLLASLEQLRDDTSTDERGTFGVMYRF